MMNSEWRLSLIGLLDFGIMMSRNMNFWMEECCCAVQMVRKISNHAKLYSALLDGNMRPERLDPFGSRARKMENYLLEEGDGKERTGYLYMELKRLDSEAYVSIGMGFVPERIKSWIPGIFVLQMEDGLEKIFFCIKI